MTEYSNYLNKMLINKNCDIYELYDRFSAVEPPFGLQALIRTKHLHKVHTQHSRNFIEWLADSVINCAKCDKHKLISYFFLIEKVCDPLIFWRNITCNAEDKDALIQESVKILQSLNSDIQDHFTSDYYKERLRREFKVLISSGEWANVHEKTLHNAMSFKHAVNYLLSNTFYILYVHSKALLITTLENKDDIPLIWGIMSNAGVNITLDIAHATKSHSLLFCCYASILSEHNHRDLTEAQEQTLTSLIAKTSNTDFFPHLMNIVARYPSRYPKLQTALGKALAKSKSPTAVIQYLEAINLRSIDFHDSCRKAVAECLSSFAAQADKERLQTAWGNAYRIWSDWKFDISSKDDVYLLDIKASALDYAIVRYFLDCCSAEERDKFIEKRLDGLNRISEQWYESHIDLKNHWNLELSQLQPVFQANEITKDPSQPYLIIDKFYTLDAIQNNKYVQAYIS